MKKLAHTPLSILDLVIYPHGKSIAEAFRSTKDLAQKAEAWGYKRFWMAEHHNLDGIASAATPLLIGYVAENTQNIRVGSGGIMLPNHAPLIVAEQFGTLETLYPGRIDLGLGRAPGTDRSTMQAIRRDSSPERDFDDLIEELLYFFAPAAPQQKVKAIPGAGLRIPLWILGSSLYSARLAARRGLPYAFAGHFAPQAMQEAFSLYRREFRPSAEWAQPHIMVGVPVVAAESDEQADFFATTLYQRFLGVIRGARRPSAKPVETMQGLWSPQEEAIVRGMTQLAVIGGPGKVREGLQNLIDLTQADELIITSDLFEHQDRLRSFEIIFETKKENLVSF